jgi:hypothetical protein
MRGDDQVVGGGLSQPNASLVPIMFDCFNLTVFAGQLLNAELLRKFM